MGEKKGLSSIASNWKSREGLVGCMKWGAGHLSGEEHASKTPVAADAQALLLPLCSAA